MSESLLNRDFKTNDVNRLRNLLMLKYGDKTKSQIGYIKKEVDHVEGDVWEENDKTWTIKDGIKQSFTKMDNIKKALRMPFLCPNCSHKMSHPYDKKFYYIHKMCFDCVIKMETRLRAEGKYEEYSMNFQLKNAVSYIKEARIFIEDYTKSSRDIYYSEVGEQQKFVGGSSEISVIDTWSKELDKIEEELKVKLTENDKTDQNS